MDHVIKDENDEIMDCLNGDTLVDKRAHGFYITDNVFIDIYVSKLGVYAAVVYNIMCRHANIEGGCFPSVITIAKKGGMSERSVVTALKRLEEYRIIAVSRERGKGNGYQLRAVSEWKRIATRADRQRKKMALIDKYGGGQVKAFRIGDVGVVVPSGYDTTAR